jgi:hypothetical protein
LEKWLLDHENTSLFDLSYLLDGGYPQRYTVKKMH